jgi:hypothetical protein
MKAYTERMVLKGRKSKGEIMTKTSKAPASVNVTSASISEVQIVLDSIAALDKARDNLVKITGKTGEIQKAYAQQMNGTFGANWWESKGEIKKAVTAEHKKFIHDFTTAGKTRAWIDQTWSRVKDDAGRVKTAAPQAQGGKDIDGKTISELKTIYNRFTAVSEDEAPLSYKVKKELEYILDQLGVEI